MDSEPRAEPDPEAPGSAPPRRGRSLLLLAAALAAVALLVALGRLAGEYVTSFAAWVEGLGVWGPVVFALGYAVATVAFVPGALLTLAAGALFGVVRGAVVVFVAAVVGSTAAFLLSRHGARRAIERRVEGNPRFAAIDRAIAAQGLRIVFLLRLSPVFPFNLLNYALGLTRVSLGDFVVASLGMIPGTLLYVYYGSLAGEVARLAAGTTRERGPLDWALYAVGFVATVAVTVVVTRAARHALEEAAVE